MTFPNDAQAKWLEAFPNETAFPDSLFFIPKWNLVDASNNIQKIRVEARMASNVNSQVLRVTTADFCEAVGLKTKILMSEPLSDKWPVPRFSRKGNPANPNTQTGHCEQLCYCADSMRHANSA